MTSWAEYVQQWHYLVYATVGYTLIVLTDSVVRKLREKKKPYITCLLDSSLAICSYLGISHWGRPNDITTAVQNAMKKTKLNDLGGNNKGVEMISRYTVVRNIGLEKSKARYSPLGHYIAMEVLQKRMECRLQFIEYLKKHPTINDVKVNSPVFVIGFPRTGTTYLHELLCEHPDISFHRTWEQMDPVPQTDDENKDALSKDRAKRYESNRSRFNMLLTLAGDGVQSIHRVGYDEAEECTTPCALELPWSILELPLNVYATKELIDIGAGETFHFYKSFLQMMAWQTKDRSRDFTWMLKCPFHLPYLKELNDAFPDATIVWTHRNPVECIASACSLYETLLHVSFETHTIDKAALGKAVCEYTKLSLEKALDTINKLGKKFKIIHVKYIETVKKPFEVCRNVVESAGLEYSAKYVEKLDTYTKKNQEIREKLKAKKGGGEKLHEYSLEEYGLSQANVGEMFKSYIEGYCK